MDSPTVLIADDNPTNRKILSVSLTRCGYTTLEAVDGLQALEIAKRELPSIVLLDVGMPKLSGFEVCKQLKGHGPTADVPVIFLTAHSDPKDIQHGFGIGGSDYVTKPFHMGEVKARLAIHLSLREARLKLEETHVQLLHAQKMESIGQLAAGIAHEINTPTQFVGDNARFLQDCFVELLPVVHESTAIARSVVEGNATIDAAQNLLKLFADIDIEYLEAEIPRALDQTIDGIKRVSTIVKAMKDFSHPDIKGVAKTDINQAVESTAVVASNEWKYVADLELDFAQELPEVPCMASSVNQVILNLIVNAAHSIGDLVGKNETTKGLITISTRSEDNHAVIRVSDTGAGIPEAARERIFDPFFTTKDVGRGTGQGLSIAHNVIVKNHGGTLDFETEIGVGTTFIIRLPLIREMEEAA